MCMRRWAVSLLAAVVLALVSAGCGSGRVAGSPQSPLAGRKWVVTGMVTPAGTAAVPAGTRAYLLFGPGAKVTGFSGCNALAGRFAAARGKITFSAVMMTLVGCARSPQGRLEAAVMGVLSQHAAYTVTGNVLSLTAPDGRGIRLAAGA